MATNNPKGLSVTITRTSEESDTATVKTPRTARFAEATAVYSPIEPTRKPFDSIPTTHYQPQPQPSDIGFGYLSSTNHSNHNSYTGPGVEMEDNDNINNNRYLPPPTPMSPLKSALKSPGAPPKSAHMILSPTFKEEQALDKEEGKTEKEQAKDLKVKYRVRIAKIMLRSVNLACSLIVVAMLASVFAIFNATRSLAPRNGLPAWAKNTKTWPQITMLVIGCVSLFMAVVIMAAYFRGGHRHAEKVAAYYTTFAVAFFIFSIVMWGIGAGILNQSKASGNGQDMWGWACKDNKRRKLFEDDVQYSLVCRLQDWALVCSIIEIVVEVFCVIIYGIVFYRFWSKRKLRKSMAVRDKARSDLYLAQLRSQSAPNTPGFPLSPRSGGWRPEPGHPNYATDLSSAEKGGEEDGNAQYPRGFYAPKPFQLQAPPIRIQGATPKVAQDGFEQQPPASPRLENMQQHVPAAPGEQQYAAVPIPGSYATPLATPNTAQPTQMTYPSMGQAFSTDHAVSTDAPSGKQ